MIALICLVAPAVMIGIGCGSVTETTLATLNPTGTKFPEGPSASQQRLEARTYLTLPEWIIVYASREFAGFIQAHKPSDFAYYQTARQFWDVYCNVAQISDKTYGVDLDTHLMLYVIGVSHTVEFIAKGIYENTVGRLSELFMPDGGTNEDRYIQQVWSEYASFLDATPWYEFPFWQRLKTLWSDVSWSGTGFIRKLERRFVFTVEFAIKAGYGYLLGQATTGTYDPDEHTLKAILANASTEDLSAIPELKFERPINDTDKLISLPRYQAFTQLVVRLAQTPAHFVEIAGNDEILLTALVPEQFSENIDAASILFTTQLLSDTSKKRLVLHVPVLSLIRVLNDLKSKSLDIEHVYDY
jgi:hypothetical protein